MMNLSRRSFLSAIGIALPFGLGARVVAASTPIGNAPVLQFRSFEDGVREAFSVHGRASLNDAGGKGEMFPCRRVEIGHSEQVRAGVQGCHNARAFAGFAAGHLRIVRTGSEPGPPWQGVRLFVSTVDIALTGGLTPGVPSRPLDFASMPPAPTFC
jgi:hypothetical protein